MIRNTVAFVSLLLAGRAASAVAQDGGDGPDVFGTSEVIYHSIPAAAFDREDSVTTYRTDIVREYVYRTDDDDAGGYFVAPLDLEDGSYLDGLRLFFRDDDPLFEISFQLCTYYSHPDGTQPLNECPFFDGSAGTPGYSSLLLDVDRLIRTREDVDGDGTADEVRWLVLVYLPHGTPELAFGGVRATWHRQVSPPPPLATFNDVPTDHPFFQFVEALVASGITAGCGSGNYCPDAPLTRGQMAVFLAKALGLHWSPFYP
jgi:hypothetical protein